MYAGWTCKSENKQSCKNLVWSKCRIMINAVNLLLSMHVVFFLLYSVLLLKTGNHSTFKYTCGFVFVNIYMIK